MSDTAKTENNSGIDFKELARSIGIPVDGLTPVFDAIGRGDREAAEAALAAMDAESDDDAMEAE